jgi:hypothetical protein
MSQVSSMHHIPKAVILAPIQTENQVGTPLALADSFLDSSPDAKQWKKGRLRFISSWTRIAILNDFESETECLQVRDAEAE